MIGSPPPEELLGQLARTAGLSCACVPDPVRRVRPRLTAVASRLGIEITRVPVGHEDLLCLLALGTAAETAETARGALAGLHRLPFLLILESDADEPEAALRAARAFGAGEWLMRDLPAASGPALLAPVDRLLEVASLAGDWFSIPDQLGLELARGEEPLRVIWRATERDRDSLATVAERVRLMESEAEAARRDRERAGAELASLRSGEGRELDRLRLERLEERAWVGEQALRIANSTSWRAGHWLSRLARRLAFKGDRGTDLPRRIAERMREPDPP